MITPVPNVLIEQKEGGVCHPTDLPSPAPPRGCAGDVRTEGSKGSAAVAALTVRRGGAQGHRSKGAGDEFFTDDLVRS